MRRSKKSLVDEVNERKIFEQVILNRCTAEQDSSFRFQSHEWLVCLIFRIFQPMSLVAQYETDLVVMQHVGMQTERLVAYNKYGIGASTSVSLHEARQFGVDVMFTASVDGQRIDAISEPLADLIVPILH